VAGSFPAAFAKAQRGAGAALLRTGTAAISTRDEDKPRAVALGSRLVKAGLRVIATGGTATALEAAGVPVERVNKISEGSPHIADRIAAGEIAMVVNTPSGRGARSDGAAIRAAAVRAGVPCMTTMEAAEAAALALRAEWDDALEPLALQDLAGSAAARVVGGPRSDDAESRD